MTHDDKETFRKTLECRRKGIQAAADRLGITIDLKYWELSDSSESRADNWQEFVLGTYGKATVPAWGMESTISIQFDKTSRKGACLGLDLTAMVGWSSTSRTVANAYLAIRLYERAVEFAAACEAIWNS